MKDLPGSFPFRDIFTSFLKEYSESTTYWYVPKARVLNHENVEVMSEILKVIFEEFLEYIWNLGTQERILNRLIELDIVRPSRPDGTQADRAALIRIWKKLLETLGLLWVQDDREIVITDAGLDLLSNQADEKRQIVEKQIVKYQYPNPSLSGAYAENFAGLLPHVFLLQVLRECDSRIASLEYELFVNLAKSQNDVSRVVQYICSWRDINEHEKQIVLERAQQIVIKTQEAQPVVSADEEPEEGPSRFNRIHLNASYQRPFFTFSGYLEFNEGDIICREPDKINELLDKLLPPLKITRFRTLEDWFAYFGDPKKQPTWLTYLISLIENAKTREEIEDEVQTIINRDLLTPEETESIERAQIEKDIETFYYAHPGLLEQGLTIKDDGRQFPTPIGRIDLLCISKNREYVVVEVKAEEARDSVFGQILRYMGWIHRNIPEAKDNVRGIILASKFPETARYSRIGLLKPDYQNFIKFKKHGLDATGT